MIESSKEIYTLLSEYYSDAKEYVAQLCDPTRPQWSPHKQALYHCGVVLAKYLEQDSETLLFCEEDISDKILVFEISRYLENQTQLIKHKGILSKRDILDIQLNTTQLNELNSQSVNAWIDHYCNWIEYETGEIQNKTKRALVFLHYSFNNFQTDLDNPLNSGMERLCSLYKDIFDRNSQFKKYGLVPIDDNRELLTISPPRIYDKQINRTLYIRNTPLHLLKLFDELRHLGYIKNLAVRLNNEPGYIGRQDKELLLEHVEFGMVFELSNFKFIPVTKLYSSENYEDSLWVFCDDQNITFEELCDDIYIYSEAIVTQVIHMQYVIENSKAFITHIDHEYIFYSIDEYEIRRTQKTSSQHPVKKQKGEKFPRLKSFKIDKSKIPFDYICKNYRKDEEGTDLPVETVQFLCYILESYFHHKDLLNEYFQKII